MFNWLLSLPFLIWFMCNEVMQAFFDQSMLRSVHAYFTKLQLTLSGATEQLCAAGAILMPLCLSKQLTLFSQQHIDQLFLGHIV